MIGGLSSVTLVLKFQPVCLRKCATSGFACKDVVGQDKKRLESLLNPPALLSQGNVLVNEAMLTGESVPQMKARLLA